MHATLYCIRMHAEIHHGSRARALSFAPSPPSRSTDTMGGKFSMCGPPRDSSKQPQRQEGYNDAGRAGTAAPRDAGKVTSNTMGD